MKIGFIGVGKMGGQMIIRLLQAGHTIVATDHNAAAIDVAVNAGALPAENREAVVEQLDNSDAPTVIWLMIPAGFVDTEIDALLALVPSGSILIDGGNSDFRLTRRRAQRCLEKGVHLIDVGTSGGIMGLENGFSMMVGGDKQAYDIVEPLIQALAQPAGYGYFGPTGAGHYVKMVHNAIEYGLMEAYAEGYMLLKDSSEYANLDLGAIGSVWQHGSIIDSKLNALATTILQANSSLDGVDGYVAQSGEAQWTLETAKEQGIAMPVVQAALDKRVASQQGSTDFANKLLAALRNGFGGHAINKQ